MINLKTGKEMTRGGFLKCILASGIAPSITLGALANAGSANASVGGMMRNVGARISTLNNNQEEEMYKELFLAMISRSIGGTLKDDSVMSVGMNAFSYCNSLTEIDFPNCTSLVAGEAGTSPFFNMANLEVVKLDSVAIVGYNEFYNCTNLKTVHLDSCTFLGDIAFHGCNKLRDVFCKNLNTINMRTFGYLDAVTNTVTFHIDNATTSTILSWNLSTHFGNTPTSKWNLFKFIGSDGTVGWNGNEWAVE